MEQYDAMMENQLPASNPNAMPNYQVPISFPQFSVDNDTMNSSYGNLPGMAGSYPTSLSTPGSNISMGGYSAPGSQPSPYSSSSASFSMPYDPPTMQGAPSLPMPTPPPQQSSKPIYSCTYCGLVLSSNNALIEHKRIHTGERPYACHICNKRFTQKAHLNIHKRIHTGEKPYACHICHKRFAQSSHLSSHKRIHTGEKPFVCGICHIGFTQKQRLDAHLKKHIERPGEDISVGTRRSSLMMANQAQMMDRMEAFRQSLPRDDAASMMHMVGQGMPYIKQESGMGDLPANNSHLHPQAAMDYKNMHDRREAVPEDMRQSTSGGDYSHKNHDGKPESGENKSREEMEGDRSERSEANKNSNVNKDQNIGTPSFSSEGMFLHPSGYVAYGGIEDSEEGQQQPSPRTGPATPGATVPPQQHMSPSGSAHRRKASIVRKRQSESPDKDTGAGGGEMADAVNGGISRFQALNQDMPNSGGGASGGGGEEDEEEEEEDVENNEPEEFKDTGEILDDKNDPPYHHGGAIPPRNMNFDPQGAKKAGHQAVETRSHSRRTSLGHEEAVNGNGPRMMTNPGPSLSYAGPANSHSNSGLVKVNNRISLVNFTADELITHLIKRDDVHCCQFCCLIFQDAAMYHIHRNMHDKQDIRKCNMCGKMLLDKYDFTAHFLSMHQN